MRKARRGPSPSLQDLKAQRSYVTCSRPLSIASGWGAARIRDVWVLVPLDTWVAGPVLGSRTAKVCVRKNLSQLQGSLLNEMGAFPPALPKTAQAFNTSLGSNPDCVQFCYVALSRGLFVWKVGPSLVLPRVKMGDSVWRGPGPGGSLAHVGLQGLAFLPRAQWPQDPRGSFSWSRDSCPPCSGLDLVFARDTFPAPGGTMALSLVGGHLAQDTRRGPCLPPARGGSLQGEMTWVGPRAGPGWRLGREGFPRGWTVVSNSAVLSGSGERAPLIKWKLLRRP